MAGLLMLAGCRTSRPAPAPLDDEAAMPPDIETLTAAVRAAETAPEAVTTAPAPVLVPTASTVAVAETSSPRLRPGLLLSVQVVVSGVREVDEPRKRIQDDGHIILPLVGAVATAGMTVEDLRDHLRDLYNSRYFINPQVMVEFVSEDRKGGSAWGTVTVLGRVKEPGLVDIPPTQDLTVTRAIQQAGGFDTSARLTAIRITRQLPDGHVKTMEVNLKALGTLGRADEDLPLRPGDIVYVPEAIF